MEDGFLQIGDETVDLGEKGRAQIGRLTRLAKFVNRYGEEAVREFDFSNLDEDGSVAIVPMIITFIGTLDEDAFLLVGEFVSGKDKEFVEENFDIVWVMDGLDWLLQQGPVRKVIERFFGNRG